MSFDYVNGILHADQCNLNELSDTYGTPLYVYSQTLITANWQGFAAHWPAPHKLCYAVKANSNLAVLNLLARLGAGFDIVSGGELARVLAAGGKAKDVVFSGVAKSQEEMAYALEQGIYCFNVESAAELERLNQVANAHGVMAPVSLRVNPDVDAQTHPYISTGLKANKFGIAMQDARAVAKRAMALPNIKLQGLDCHIGSQILTLEPFLDAADIMLNLIHELREEGIKITHLDMGGGMGIPYQQELAPDVSVYLQALLERAENMGNLTMLLEPGRAIVGNAGTLITTVEYLKSGEDKNFVLVDAAMNDLMRPALYQAYHDIIPVRQHDADKAIVDVVGPVCETGDFLGHARHLSAQEGDRLAVMNAGAYGFTMSSNYNTRPRAAEVMVNGGQVQIIRERERLEDLWKGEHLLETPE
ncbi:diaminopimelate decarboxylase [Pseudidiomarina donghaiensis]|uniref:Diaminopimelate decarboxylase n=1 Tax=Pseudidiomarina donghaiensis TaxID=519452 RepID=A0A432XHX2_9GAMM|nr:diaminopimelate decarboxylase [Pseudidiomarina donghaiensis]RUO48315.1 diaminopimelate decarboxylase [Pseudidiomarina donghaiensis]SFV24397.1 diaminopimelate decarboxylase [Pseudidiomarina donghaiensis]